MRELALKWAAGWRVFPLRPNDKKPLPGSHGFLDASSDPEVVAAMTWEVDGAPCNIGVATGNGLVVLDVDCKNGKNGFDSLTKIGLTKASLEQFGTFMVLTPSGGVHYYFKSSQAVRSGTDVLGPNSGVDIRGDGGYIVVPPSQIDAKHYKVVAPASVVDGSSLVPNLSELADWAQIASHFPAAPEHSRQQQAPSSWEDLRFGQAATSDVVERARSYLLKCPPAVSGHGGHNATFKVASILANGFCLDKETALILLQEWNLRCEPPWSDAELKHKLIDSALKGPPAGKKLGWLRYPSTSPEQNALVAPVSAEEPEADGDGEGEGEWQEEADTARDLPYPPHFVGATAAWIEMRCEKPFLPFACLAALAVWATVLARKVMYENQAPVLYGGMIAASSNGKDTPMSLTREVLQQIGVSPNHLAGRLSSWNAGVEALQRTWWHPVGLGLVDEAAGYFGGVALKSDYGLADFIKAVWSRGLGTLEPQARTRKSGTARLRALHHPAYSMLLATQPSALGDAIRTEQLEDGLLPRALLVVRHCFEATIHEDNLRYSRLLADSPGGVMILERARQLWNWLEGADKEFNDIEKLESEDAEDSAPPRVIWANPVEFTATPEAAEVFSSFIATTQARIQPAAEGKEGPYGYLWGKAAENAKRIALIIAATRCAANGGPYTIKEDEARWAVTFVELSVNAGIDWAKNHMADTPFQRMANRVREIIRAAGAAGVSKRDLNRKLRHTYPPTKVVEALLSLSESGCISMETVPTRGAPKVVYRLARRKRGQG